MQLKSTLLRILCLAMLLLPLAASSQIEAWELSTQPGNQVSNTATTATAGLTAGTLSRGAGVAAAAAGGSISSNGWFNAAGVPTTLADAIANNEYYQFTLPVNAGFTANVTSIGLVVRSSNTGPNTGTLRSSVDGFSSDLGTVTITAASVLNTLPVSLSNLTGTVTFRFYGYGNAVSGSPGTAGTMRIGTSVVALDNDLILSGSVVAAPPCEVIGYSFNNISSCNDNGTPGNSADDYFTVNVDVFYSNSTIGDSLVLSGGDLVFRQSMLALVGTNVTSTFSNVRFRADGSPVTFTGQIGTGPTINCSLPGTGPAVGSCSGGPPAPANDNCANAIPIACGGMASGTTTTATNDGPVLDCTGGSTAPDVWYTITGTGTAITASLCGSGYDTQIDVYTGGCGALVNIGGCSDDFCGLQSQMTWASTLGTVYLIRVHGFGGNTGNFTLDITCTSPAPANDLCANAIPLACGDIWTGTTSGAGDDIALGQAPNCDGGATAGGVWYSFVGDGGTYVVNTCPDADYDTKLAIYTGACGALSCVASNNDFCGVQSSITLQTVNGTTYNILVYGNGQTGDFNLQLICIPANGSATVACPALAVPPTAPNAIGGCGPIIPTGPVITENPSPLTCEGTRTYTYSYDDNCGPSVTGGDTGERGAGAIVVATWSFTYTIERNPFSTPNDTSLIVSCLSQATQLTPPTVLSNCGEVLTPTGPVVTDSPNPLNCEGTRTYTFTYTDCEGNQDTWSTIYTIERNPFTVPANGAATVACPALAVAPALPTVTSNCGEVLTPTGPVISNVPDPLTCEGTRTYTYTYTDCEGNSATWSFVYTIERNPFTVPANGAATVACPALATPPTPPTVLSNCGEVLATPTPVITNNPNPISCEGTRTYAYTYMDCEGNTATWSFVYTIERLPFTVPANGAATVNCPANATQPVPPVVLSNCGETLTPTGPVITNNPNPLTCEGTRTYAWTYTDCEGNTATWSFVYTIERQPFVIATPNGGATVDCPDDTDVVPTPPVVLSNCGEVLTPVVTSTPKNACEGDRVYYFTYTDCEGNTATWLFNYHTEYLDFTVPASEVVTVECPINATLPTPPVVFDNCGNLLNPAGPFPASSTNASGCEGSRSYTWTYTDCEGNTHDWSKTYIFLYSADFFAPVDEVNIVSCLAYAVAPFPQVLFDYCGQQIHVSNPVMTQSIAAGGCSGWRKFSYVYTDCGGHSHPWSFTYYIEDNQAPHGTCAGGNSPVSVDVTNLQCIEDVPCPDDYDFDAKIEELLEAGNYFDVCYGDELYVTLEDYTDLWECSDPDGDGDFTFGRTFYFRIADRCGNEYPSLCEVTYSGACQPLATFSMADWGIEGGAPGNTVAGATSDLSVISTLLNSGPVLIGGSNRSISLTDAQCVMNMMPGTGGPAVLANCQQTNCTGGCNPMGIGGLKNALAANAIALELNIRYNTQYNGLTRTNVRNQGLGCIYLHPCIYYCDANGECRVRFFDAQGTEHTGAYTIGGLQDLVNLYLNGGLSMTIGQKVIYGTALNQSLLELNGYFGDQTAVACDNVAPDYSEIEKLLKEYGLDFANGTGVEKPNFEIVPNPASNDFTFKLYDIAENQEISLEIINSLGQKVMLKKYSAVGFVNEQIDISSLGNGLYFVNVKVGENRFEQKLVISKG